MKQDFFYLLGGWREDFFYKDYAINEKRPVNNVRPPYKSIN